MASQANDETLWWLTLAKLWDNLYLESLVLGNTLTTLGCHSPGNIRILNTVDPLATISNS